MPTKWKSLVDSAVSRISAGGPKWRMVSALIGVDPMAWIRLIEDDV
jgi:hypothetical protein